jgi:PAS domain S-box-containing protein
MIRKVLIVDDNSTNLYLLEALLRGHGMEVVSAVNGRDALDRARLDPPDLIVTDILMPVMDGYALCRQWKLENALKEIPFIFYTATYTDPKDEDFALGLGADRFILKPQEPDAFMRIIEEVLKEKHTARQAPAGPLGEEMEFFRQHNEILFRKLEKKMLDLETANENLRALEELYRLSFDNVMDVICLIDSGLRITNVSPSVERILGYGPQEFVGQPVSFLEKVLAPESFELALTNIDLALRGRRFPATVYRFFSREGVEKFGEISASPVMREGGVIGIVCVARDITDRRTVDRMLRQRQEMLTRTENIAHIGSWEWNLATDAVTWSDELYRIFQRDPAAWVPSFAGYAGLMHPDDAVRLRDAVESAIAGGMPYQLELRALRPDGTIRRCLERGYPERGADGKVARLFGSLQDVTDFKLARERIEHLNTVLRAIREVNQLIVRERDRDTLIHEGCRLLVKHRGYASAMIILTDENDRPVSWAGAGMDAAFGAVTALLEGGRLPPCCAPARSSEGVVPLEAEDGVCSRCPIAATHAGSGAMCIRLVNNGNALGYFAAVTEEGVKVDLEEQGLFDEMAGDIAYALHVMQKDRVRERIERDHKSLQSQMIQAQKLESVGRLAGGVAHDYNNMLGVIIGYAELAMDKLALGDPLHADLKEILSAAKRSSEMTRKLLAFARKQPISPRVLDLNEAVESMLKMLRRLIGENIELAWLPGARLWPVKIDPVQLDQVLANLCVNSRDAIGAGVGRIIIETDNATFDKVYCTGREGFLPGDFALLAVTDNGCGMDKETLDMIFEPFFTTKTMGKGTGLGLATVYGIVKQNDGFIKVYSELGKRTIFKIYLPRHAGEGGKEETQGPVLLPESRGETVLIVEDEPAIMKMGRMMLEKLGYQVLEAGTPGEAMNLAVKHLGKIHLLFTDMIMPEMDGRQLARRLHTLYPDMRVLFMSGYTAAVITRDGVLEEGVQFIQKPFSIRELAVKVREVLERNTGGVIP